MTNENLEQRYEHWRRMVEEQKKSDLSQKEICNQQNLVLSQFVYYRCQLKKTSNHQITKTTWFEPVKFAENKESAASSELKLSLPNGFNCSFPCDVDPALFKRLVEILLSC